jgi:hypothetical protein
VAGSLSALAATAPVDHASPPPCGAPTEHLGRVVTAHLVKSSRFAWLVAGCMRPVRATALHGQQVLECPGRTSRHCGKNHVRPDRHVLGAYQCFLHSAPVSLDCRAVTQGQRAGNPGSANCRSRHPTRTRSGRASWSPRLLHRRALGKSGILLARMPSPPERPRVLDRMKKLEIYLLLMLTASLRSTAHHLEGTHSAGSALLKSLAARDCPLWCSFCARKALFTLF